MCLDALQGRYWLVIDGHEPCEDAVEGASVG